MLIHEFIILSYEEIKNNISESDVSKMMCILKDNQRTVLVEDEVIFKISVFFSLFFKKYLFT
jgi:hypothetical protein